MMTGLYRFFAYLYRVFVRARRRQQWHFRPRLEQLENRTLLAAYTLETVADLSSGIDPASLKSEGSDPADFVYWGNKLVFSADDVSHGRELWITDGTPSGTQLLTDINPGSVSSLTDTVELTVWGNRIIFNANVGIHGMEPWISDGTSAGTRLLKDIYLGTDPRGSFARDFTIGGDGKLYFLATDGMHGEELWVSDGTTAGTKIVSDLRPGNQGSGIGGLTVSASGVTFLANPTGNGGLLYGSNGTENGTVVLFDAANLPGADGIENVKWFSINGQSYAQFNDQFLMKVTNNQFTSIDYGAAASNGAALIQIGNNLAYSKFNPTTNNYELWRVNLSSSGSQLVQTFATAFSATGSLPTSHTLKTIDQVGDRFLFQLVRTGQYAPSTFGPYQEIWSVNIVSLSGSQKLLAEPTVSLHMVA